MPVRLDIWDEVISLLLHQATVGRNAECRSIISRLSKTCTSMYRSIQEIAKQFPLVVDNACFRPVLKFESPGIYHSPEGQIYYRAVDPDSRFITRREVCLLRSYGKRLVYVNFSFHIETMEQLSTLSFLMPNLRRVSLVIVAPGDNSEKVIRQHTPVPAGRIWPKVRNLTVSTEHSSGADMVSDILDKFVGGPLYQLEIRNDFTSERVKHIASGDGRMSLFSNLHGFSTTGCLCTLNTYSKALSKVYKAHFKAQRCHERCDIREQLATPSSLNNLREIEFSVCKLDVIEETGFTTCFYKYINNLILATPRLERFCYFVKDDGLRLIYPGTIPRDTFRRLYHRIMQIPLTFDAVAMMKGPFTHLSLTNLVLPRNEDCLTTREKMVRLIKDHRYLSSLTVVNDLDILEHVTRYFKKLRLDAEIPRDFVFSRNLCLPIRELEINTMFLDDDMAHQLMKIEMPKLEKLRLRHLKMRRDVKKAMISKFSSTLLKFEMEEFDIDVLRIIASGHARRLTRLWCGHLGMMRRGFIRLLARVATACPFLKTFVCYNMRGVDIGNEILSEIKRLKSFRTVETFDELGDEWFKFFYCRLCALR
jgi:hypothetical protein